MNKLVWLIVGLAIAAPACQAGLPTVAVPTTVSTVTTVIPASTQTEIPSPTSSPFPMPQPINCTDDSCLDACLKRIEKSIQPIEYEPLPGAYAGNIISVNLVYYDVRDGELGEPYFLHVPDAFKVYQQDTPPSRLYGTMPPAF